MLDLNDRRSRNQGWMSEHKTKGERNSKLEWDKEIFSVWQYWRHLLLL